MEQIPVQNIDEVGETPRVSFRQRVEELFALRKIRLTLLGLGLTGTVVIGALLILKPWKSTSISKPPPTPTPEISATPTYVPTPPVPTLIPTPPLTPTSTPTPTSGPSKPTPTPTPTINRNIPVLVLKYFPTKNGKLDPDITGMSDDLTTIRAQVDGLALEIIGTLEKGSAYHGYKDPTPTALLDYFVIEEKEFLTAMPLSDNEIPWNPGIYRPNYYQILSELNICDYVENRGIKEVWVWGYHHGDLEPAESNMAGPYGDISNSERIDDMPVCSKTYTLYNYNYSRGLAEALEDHTHQVEAVLKYVDHNLFWNKFVRPYGNQAEINHCGWTHYPPNGRSDYDWYNEEYVWSDCEDWKPDGGGEKKQVNCHTWAGAQCSDDGGTAFKIWWMQNIPNNWWGFIADFDQAVKSGKGLAF